MTDDTSHFPPAPFADPHELSGHQHRLPTAPAEAELRGFSQTFVDPKLERAFQDHLFNSSIAPEYRVNVPLAAATFVLFALVDLTVVPDILDFALYARFLVTVPIMLVLVVISWTRHLRLLYPTFVPVIAIVGSLHFLVVGAVAEGIGGVLYRFFCVVFIILTAAIGRSGVYQTFAIGVVITASHQITELVIYQGDARPWVFITATLVLVWFYAMHLSRLNQGAARVSYWRGRLINRQIEALDAEHQRSERLLTNVLPRSIADRLKDERGEIADSIDDVVVLFADIHGFTEYSASVTPEQLVKSLNQIFSGFDELADQHGLEKIKTIGDAYMVAGGLPEPMADPAGAMARLALGMLSSLEQHNARSGQAFKIRIGVHAGPVVAGVIGKRKFIYDLWGDTVNTASRMESHGKPGRIQISARVRELLGDRFEVERRGEIEVKGKGEMETWYLIGERSG